MQPKQFLIHSACVIAAAFSLAGSEPETIPSVPPPGAAIPREVRAELREGAEKLGDRIEALKIALVKRPGLLELLPDVQIFHNAIRYCLEYNEIFNPAKELPAARDLIHQGLERAAQLEAGSPGWTKATGLIVRGYKSKIDGSIQPYGLVIPPGVAASPETPRRLDIWFHGHNRVLSELNFLTERQQSAGDFVPANTVVLHPYGRYCNSNKFAGEVDLLEAIAHAERYYAIDPNRIIIRGFSMGGSACWQFAVHYAGLWAGAAPGAGSVDTEAWLRVYENEIVMPTWWERKLYHLYDCEDYALNLFHCPTVAYTGELDSQKQAADTMARALKKEGMELTHIVSPQTSHRIHPDAKPQINARIDAIAAAGRNPMPREVRFTTWTLRYNQMFWVTLDGLEQHWKRARVRAQILGSHAIDVETLNIEALTLDMPAGLCPLDVTIAPTIRIDGAEIIGPRVPSDRSWRAHLRKRDGQWSVAVSNQESGLRKLPGLQGPIDDAFMDSFIMVLPSGRPSNEIVERWTSSEQEHAIKHWRQHFRGEARTVLDTDLSEEQIRTCNLILWGDPQSNTILAKIAPRLPIPWTKEKVTVGSQQFPADRHVLVLIYPNPLNPDRYVVLNSGFTYREYDYLNNARQVPKLPDFAVIDASKPMTVRRAGEVVTAGFFSEKWELTAKPEWE